MISFGAFNKTCLMALLSCLATGTALIYCLAVNSTVNAATLSDANFPPEAELIVLLDAKSPLKIANSPDDILRSVAATSRTPSDSVLYQMLGSPLKARYVISERLTAEQIQRLGSDSPRVLLDQFVVLSYPDTAASETNRLILAANMGIASVTKNARVYFSATPSDPGFQSGPFGLGFMNYQWGLQQMNFATAWDTVKGNAYVAVLDTGIQLGHPDLTANFKPQLSAIHSSATTLDDEFAIPGPPYFIPLARGHGTHVAGIIAANTNDGYGVAGGCWNCSLMIQKLSDAQIGFGVLLDRVVAGINGAVDRGAQVINMSFGNYASENCAGSVTLFCVALRYATNRSTVMVAAAGNNIVRRDCDNANFCSS